MKKIGKLFLLFVFLLPSFILFSCKGNKNETFYTITWENYDGNILEVDNVKRGDIPSYDGNTPTKGGTQEYSYIFSGWTTEVTKALEDKTYVANFYSEKNKYTYTFYDTDGTELKKVTADYGTAILPPSSPTKDSNMYGEYEFSYWSKDIVGGTGVSIFTSLKENVSYYANYTFNYNDYTVSFVDDDGSDILTKSYHYGDTITIPSNPTKESTKEYNYKFVGWDKNVSSTVLGNVTYTAVYEAEKRTYSYTFYDTDGTELKKVTALYGTPIVPPSNPTKDSDMYGEYEFSYWSKDIVGGSGVSTFTSLEENVSYYANYTLNYNDYTVSFVDYDGSDILTKSYHYGDTITIPSNPTRTSTKEYTYNFIGWDKNVSSTVLGNVTYTAVYEAEKRTYSYTFIVEGTETISYALYGSEIVIPEEPVKSSTAQYEYQFAGWVDFNTQEVVSTFGLLEDDMIFEAKFDEVIREYEITWLNFDGVLIEKTKVKYGIIPSHDEPTRKPTNVDMWEFGGWTPTVVAVTGDATYKAIWNQYKYKITVDCQIPGFTVSGASYIYYNANATITLKATPDEMLSSYATCIWQLDDEDEYTGNKFVFTMPKRDVVVTITPTGGYYLMEDTIYFGSYPQNSIHNMSLIQELNELVGTPISSNFGYNWNSYEYYSLSTVSEYMYYIDVDIDNNGVLDYRGVYLTKYRPYMCQNSNPTSGSDMKYTYQDDYGYDLNKTYWFKYNSIAWEQLTTSNGKALLITKYVIDSQDYNHYYQIANEEVPYEHNGGTGYSDSYALSDIRKWLYLSFYATAFNDLQKSLLKATSISYDYGTIDNEYIFLLSKDEAANYMTSDNLVVSSSIYAQSQGLINTKNTWWTRSGCESKKAYYIGSTGHAQSDYVSNISYGIRPACWIEL